MGVTETEFGAEQIIRLLDDLLRPDSVSVTPLFCRRGITHAYARLVEDFREGINGHGNPVPRITSLSFGFKAMSFPPRAPLGLVNRKKGGTSPLSVMLHAPMPSLPLASCPVPTIQPFDGISRNLPPMSFDDCSRLHISVVGTIEDQRPISAADGDQVTHRIDDDVSRILKHGVGPLDLTEGCHVAFAGARKHQDVFFTGSVSAFDHENFVVDPVDIRAVPGRLKLGVRALNDSKGRLRRHWLHPAV